MRCPLRAVGALTQRGLRMAAYAIMRCKKLASMGSVASSLKHCFRERETLNANPERTPSNMHAKGAARSTDEAMGKLRTMLPEKRRKDAVLAVEYLLTASPEWWAKATPEEQQKFFQRSHAWLAKKYGADRIIVATVHKDETSPHLSAFVVPLTQDGRLSAKEFIGNRAQMQADQTSFAAAVRDLGLERGIPGSKAKHQSIRAHYAAIAAGEKDVPQLTAEELKPQRVPGETFMEKLLGAQETREGVVQRINRKLKAQVAPITQKAAMARSERSRAKEMQETAERLKGYAKAFQGLTKEQVSEVLQLAQERRQQNQQIERQKLIDRMVEREMKREKARIAAQNKKMGLGPSTPVSRPPKRRGGGLEL